jgi:hypothetical protein
LSAELALAALLPVTEAADDRKELSSELRELSIDWMAELLATEDAAEPSEPVTEEISEPSDPVTEERTELRTEETSCPWTAEAPRVRATTAEKRMLMWFE